jgi:hypothetical protein
MNKTFWIGLVVLFIVAQATGYVVHQVWLSDTYQALASAFRPEAEMLDLMWIMMLTGLGVLFLFCYIFTKGHEGKGIGEGIRYGALIGTLVSLPTAIDAYVIYPITVELAAMWFVSGVLSFVIFGAIFAAIYKPSSSHADAATS